MPPRRAPAPAGAGRSGRRTGRGSPSWRRAVAGRGPRSSLLSGGRSKAGGGIESFDDIDSRQYLTRRLAEQDRQGGADVGGHVQRVAVGEHRHEALGTLPLAPAPEPAHAVEG